MNNKNNNKKWRIFPKIRYTNFRKKWPIGDDCFQDLFTFNKFWGGRVVNVCIKHHCLTLDFRKNWVEDMVNSYE